MSVYTVTVWEVKPGREEDFVAAWHALGEWTIEEGFESHGTLLRDRANPRRFVSFGPWKSADAAARWRDHPGYAERFARLEETLKRVEPGTLDLVMQVS